MHHNLQLVNHDQMSCVFHHNKLHRLVSLSQLLLFLERNPSILLSPDDLQLLRSAIFTRHHLIVLTLYFLSVLQLRPSELPAVLLMFVLYRVLAMYMCCTAAQFYVQYVVYKPRRYRS